MTAHDDSPLTFCRRAVFFGGPRSSATRTYLPRGSAVDVPDVPQARIHLIDAGTGEIRETIVSPQGFAIAVHHPGQQDIDNVGIHGSAAAGLISLAVEGAFLNLQVAGVGDGFRNVEQQKVVEKHVGVGGKRRRRPILPAVAHVVGGQTVLQTLEEQRTQLV